MPEYSICARNRDGGILPEYPVSVERERPPFSTLQERRVLLLPPSYYERGGRRLRRDLVGSGQHLWEAGIPLPLFARNDAYSFEVRGENGWGTNWVVERMRWREVVVRIPFGRGKGRLTFPVHEPVSYDFTDYEMQPFRLTWAYPPVEALDERGRKYVRWGEENPFPPEEFEDPYGKGMMFLRVLCRTQPQFDTEKWELYLTGDLIEPAWVRPDTRRVKSVMSQMSKRSGLTSSRVLVQSGAARARGRRR